MTPKERRNYLKSLVRMDRARTERKRRALSAKFGAAADLTRVDAKLAFISALYDELTSGEPVVLREESRMVLVDGLTRRAAVRAMTFPYFGTVSHGTMRNEDLIPCFLEIADDLIERAWFTPRPAQKQELEELHSRVDAAQEHNHNRDECSEPLDAQGFCTRYYWNTEEASEDCHWLFELLDEVAPPKHYFGAIEGDGSDYGFWRVEEDD